MRQADETKILDQWGKPIEKSIDLNRFFGGNNGSYDAWGKQRNPSRSSLVKEYKSTAYACANLNAQAVVKTDLRLYRCTKPGQKSRWPIKSLTYSEQKHVASNPYQRIKLTNNERIEEIVDHPLLNVLNCPNQWADLVGLLEFTQLFQEICGAAYWYIAKNQIGTPVSIFLLCPQHVNTNTDSIGNITGYVYGDIEYKPEEIIPFLLPNPSNPWLDGFSPLRAVFESINIEDKLASTTAAILDNEGRPAGILAAKDGIGADEASRWEQRFSQKFRRAGNGGVIVLDEDASFTPLTFSPRDLSWLAIHDTSRLAICNAYGVPYGLIDESSSSQYNVDVTLRQRHVEDAIVPRLRRNQSVLNRYLIPMFDPSGILFLAFDDASPTNREMKLAEDVQLVNCGVKTRNEVRLERGFEPRPDGEQLAIPQGAALAIPTTTEAAPTTDTTAPANDPPIDTTPAEAASQGDLQASALNGAQVASMLQICQLVTSGQMPKEAARIALQMSFPLMDQSQVAALVNALEVQAAPALPPAAPKCQCGHCVETKSNKPKGHGKKLPEGKELAEVLKEFFKDQRKHIVASLTKSYESAKAVGIKADLPSEFVDLADWDRELYEKVQPIIEMYLEKNYKEQSAELVARAGVSPEVFNVTNPNLKKKAEKLALHFCEETNKTTSLKINDAIETLRQSLGEGLGAGDRMTDLTKRVEDIFDECEQSRAERISQTEASRAHHEGQRESAKDSGVVTGFGLLLSSEACPLCVEVYNQGPIGLDDNFYKDDSPGTPEEYADRFVPIHPNCECAIECILDTTEGE